MHEPRMVSMNTRGPTIIAYSSAVTSRPIKSYHKYFAASAIRMCSSAGPYQPGR